MLNKKQTVSLVVASLLVMILGCSNNESIDTKKSDREKVANSEEITGPGVEGYVKKQTSNRGFLLEVTKDHQMFDTGTLIHVGVDEETMLDELEVGQNVSVWYGGPILESYPPKIKGLKIEIKDSEN
ncbi:hypothetical protein BABA_14017 [Neobacillus bataviensis LMG 21833]|uniref:DUF3221 domain-containing protein n=1 Tax=Neobacillus bataviensis LMG 21833 TaxID=1117379 RepID=K6C7C6_9BACI|nr:DUF3221 domain-containing protein [Neobacillus bataviensis]EKN67010.1 hypothetical protein BABA_14017 [Neobacillus bataviensis LMG 21833]